MSRPLVPHGIGPMPITGGSLWRIWRQENAEKIKAVKKLWLSLNKLRTRVYTENRRVRKQANGGSHTPEQIEVNFTSSSTNAALAA